MYRNKGWHSVNNNVLDLFISYDTRIAPMSDINRGSGVCANPLTFILSVNLNLPKKTCQLASEKGEKSYCHWGTK